MLHPVGELKLRLAVQTSIVCLMLSFTSLDAAAEPVNSDAAVDYNRDIKPILADRCYACHGPDANQRKAELRLDVRAVAVAAAIEPGSAAQSELVRRVSSSDPDEQMPPADSNKRRLSPREIELLKQWIDGGARFEDHWAYVVPERPKPPNVQDGSWPRGVIDRFVLARLEAEKLRPSPEADRRTLLRRLSFDLTGLPPKPEEVAAFQADKSPDAYEKVIDRLLASQQYGERMAMHWLDLVRYADTNGIHGDNHRDHAPFRDYVIAAFNDNMPFDRFTLEQIAGDLLPNPTREQRIASGYNRLNMTTREGGAQPKEYLAKYAADRVRNASSVWLGATMGCSECHDHKFDPFTMRDFYSFASFFADVQETPVGTQASTPVPRSDQLARQKQLDNQIAAVEKTLNTSTPALEAAQRAWEKKVQEEAGHWTLLVPVKLSAVNGTVLKAGNEGIISATGASPATDVYTFDVKAELPGITAVRVDVLRDGSLPKQGPGRAANGNFVLSELEVLADDLLGDPQPLELQNASATYQQQGFDAALAIDGAREKPKQGWAIANQPGVNHTAVFQLKQPLSADAGEKRLTIVLHQHHGDQHTIGRLRLWATNQPPPVKAERQSNLPEKITGILGTAAEKRTDAQQKALATHYRLIAPLLDAKRAELASLKAQRDALIKSFPRTLVTVSVKPRMMRILPRGNWLDESGEVVSPATPGFLRAPDAGERRATRLDLANWLVAKDNPLVARVAVNRFWRILFGEGIVRSLDDFGSQGTPPTHPRLLDWLAVEFVESGWDVKHMIKSLAMSQAYRQSSLVSDALARIDPQNRWLARQGRFRLDAEMVRDNALAVSGLLVKKIGGASVKPYQPAGYWSHLNFPKRVYSHDQGENQYRRGLYTYWARTFLHPSLLAFDAPSREECAVQRPRSNTPLQALVLLNDPTYVEAARVFAGRIIQQGGKSAAERIGYAYQQTLARQPSADEVRILGGLLEKHAKQYQADSAQAGELLKVGQAPAPKGVDPIELAAWTSVSHVILNLHETITRN